MFVKTFTSPDEFNSEKGMKWLGYGIFNLPAGNITNGRFESYKENENSYELSFIESGVKKVIKIEKDFFHKGLTVVVYENNFSNGPL